MRRSVDGGYGWGPETAIARVEGRSLCSPATVTTSDGDLHIFFSIYNGTWEGCKKDFELCDILTGRIISTDGGHTSDIPHDQVRQEGGEKPPEKPPPTKIERKVE